MEPGGSRIGVVFNGSPLFTGDSGSGESEIRKWIIENDWLETIVQLPDRMFFNTGITTYLWIISNKKCPQRKGKVQLINGKEFSQSMRKNLGFKGKKISDQDINKIVEIYNNFEEGEVSKIFDNKYFGYTKVQVEQPLLENGQPLILRNGKIKPDPNLRDHERIPLDTSIEEYFKKEVQPNLPNSWMDRSKDKVGYEISLDKVFFKFEQPKDSELIKDQLLDIEERIRGYLKDI